MFPIDCDENLDQVLDLLFSNEFLSAVTTFLKKSM